MSLYHCTEAKGFEAFGDSTTSDVRDYILAQMVADMMRHNFLKCAIDRIDANERAPVPEIGNS